MNERTTRSTVTFRAAFKLPEFDETQLAGTYDIDTIEQGIQGNERTVYIRTATLFYLRRIGQTSVVTVDPKALLGALEADALHCL
ncbi:hypothetical protein [Novosphingobium sp. M1R2S20]|uniref:Uncharacterized protein n=1 Tax=Novosphingobium rhizovicinum TaxID=3228928 RepID=A0ABV3RBY6_9SPHN